MKTTSRIVEINFSNSKFGDYYKFEYEGHKFIVHRYGIDYDLDHAKEIIKQMGPQADAICLSQFLDTIRYHNRAFTHREYLELRNYPTPAPISDGSAFREILLLNQMNQAIKEGLIDPTQGIFFPTSLSYLEMIKELRKKYEKHLFFGDLLLSLRLPRLNQPSNSSFLTLTFLHLANLRSLKSNIPTNKYDFLNTIGGKKVLKQIQDCKYIVAQPSTLLIFKPLKEVVKNKTLILPYGQPNALKEIQDHGLKETVNLFPKNLRLAPQISYSVVEAVMKLSHDITSDLSIEGWEKFLNNKLELSDSTRNYIALNKPSFQQKLNRKFNSLRKSAQSKKIPADFAFIVHALSKRDLARIPGFSFMKNSPPLVTDNIEKAMTLSPGVIYGRINNIISTHNQKEINGIVYGLMATPQAMKMTRPEHMYRRIEKICHHAAHEGAQIIGLGAYTKIIGDSGYTINRNSPIPVTTGNSLSAAATLWSARIALEKLGFVKISKEDRKVHGVAMVIGATGSIGSASAKILSQWFKQIIIVAPRLHKLEELKKQLKDISPHCHIKIETDANKWAPFSDLIVTATSAFDQEIVNIKNIKPGSVVCDCSRPLDFSAADARKRPDILIIESGELILPGPYSMSCDIGLPGKTVYACLAETAVLTLDDRFESFTMGRNIQWEKVKEIYRLCQKHGVQLADIRSHTGVVTDKEIELIRQRALLYGAQSAGESS